MFEQFLGPDHFDIMPHLVAIGLAYLLAFPIGWNREKSERSAGLRTFPLVAVASCGFIQAAESMTADTPEAMARIVEGLITGMGLSVGGHSAPQGFGQGHRHGRQPLDYRCYRRDGWSWQP